MTNITPSMRRLVLAKPTNRPNVLATARRPARRLRTAGSHMAKRWTKGRDTLGSLAPLLDRWVATAASPAGFSWVVESRTWKGWRRFVEPHDFAEA